MPNYFEIHTNVQCTSYGPDKCGRTNARTHIHRTKAVITVSLTASGLDKTGQVLVNRYRILTCLKGFFKFDGVMKFMTFVFIPELEIVV